MCKHVAALLERSRRMSRLPIPSDTAKFDEDTLVAVQPLQYGSRVKMNVVPVTIGALAPTNDTLTSLT